ncbi:MAG: PfkB family carbohydrate kinase [Planctomycetia bacterium]|nr:PfkB family carbohydrate kinase [Planctomycetia bacterium]
MSLLTLGSAAYDTIDAPYGSRDRVLGGSAIYASFAASYFTESRLVAVVGADWKPEYSGLLRSRGVDLQGLEIRQDGLTSHWSGRYFDDMNQRESNFYHANVMDESYDPIVPDSYRDTPYVLLANGSPALDMALLDKIQKPKLVIADTMDFYINNMRGELLELLTRIDGLILNDSEASLLTGKREAYDAADALLELGPKFVIVKRGEYGAFWYTREQVYLTTAFPTRKVVDPTGAGDSFAGAMLGCLAQSQRLDSESIKKALFYATVVASFTVEGFSLERLQFVTRADVEKRAALFREALV